MSDYLFNELDLDDLLREKIRSIPGHVDQIPEAQFLISTDQDIIDTIVYQFHIEPISIFTDQRRMEKHEASVDVSFDRNRHFFDDDGPHLVPGTEVIISIPYSGADGLWKCNTNPHSSMKPTGIVYKHENPKVLKIVLAIPHDADPTEYKNRYDRNLELILSYIARSGSQVDAYNKLLDGTIRSAILDRRHRLQKHAGLAELLDIPLKLRTDAPSIKPIRLELKKPPALPVPPKSGLAPEHGISAELYEHILNIIRHEGRSFESTPSTFAKLAEEELRDIILAHLNGHFKGGASGETFRRNGKTDIRVEEQDRSAFVAECKVWRGSSDASKAVDQLLSYLTWRDSKAALIFFNTNVSAFSDLPSKLYQTILGHRFFVSQSSNLDSGEFRTIMRSQEDPGRRVHIHSFIFDLYCR